MTELSDAKEVVGGAPREPSATLLEAREKLGLSQKEVADKLFLTSNVIKHIDQGEFDLLPRPAFIRGYLRSYARVLDLNGDHIVEVYDKELTSTKPVTEVRGLSEEKVGSAHITGPVLQTGLVGLCLFFAVIGLIWWLVSDTEQERVLADSQPTIIGPERQIGRPLPAQPFSETIMKTGVVEEITKQEKEESDEFDAADAYQFDDNGLSVSMIPEPREDLLSESEPLNGSDDDGSLVSLTPEPQEVSESKSEPLNGSDDDGSLVSSPPEPQEVSESKSEFSSQADGTDSVSIERYTDGDRNYIVVDAGGSDELILNFSEDCWVEVTDSRYGVIYFDLNTETDVLTLLGTAPLDVLLGKATRVEMFYNGVPFDLGPYIGVDDTAKLEISG